MGYPKIAIDYSKCDTPFACTQCLQVCPQAVFYLRTMKMARLQETDKEEPGAFQVRVIYRDKCFGCGDCARVCPKNAITVTQPQ